MPKQYSKYQQFSRTFQSIDKFGENVEFKEGSEGSFTTNLGALLSLIVIAASTIYGINKYIGREQDTNHGTSIEKNFYSESTETISFETHGFTGGMFEFDLPDIDTINPKTGDALLLEDLMTIEAVLINEKCEDEKDFECSNPSNEIVPLNLRRCLTTDFENYYSDVSEISGTFEEDLDVFKEALPSDENESAGTFRGKERTL